MRHNVRRAKNTTALLHIVGMSGLILLGILPVNAALHRPVDPVVITGGALEPLLNIDPSHLVAFRSDGSSWSQVPVQVDERDSVEVAQIYNYVTQADCEYCGNLRGSFLPVYNDPATFTGPDSNPSLDEDDEVVWMASDMGDPAATDLEDPAGVVAGSGLTVTVTDPLDGAVAYLYLFESEGRLEPSAGQQYVTYDFNLLSGDYLETYNTAGNPDDDDPPANPENSIITTDAYRRHFSDRWIDDGLSMSRGGASDIDILDRHKNLFYPDSCVRHEDTFSAQEGAMIANISGPVRAIRSYMGANSGPLTQRDHIFYASREDVTTFLRVHPIDGIMDFYDYEPEAIGMTYYNDLNPAGTIVDGSPDDITLGNLAWELISGEPGSLTVVHQIRSDLDLDPTSYQLDDATPEYEQCTGDEFSIGASGPWIDQPIPNTDPRNNPSAELGSIRILYFDGPGLSTADAAVRSSMANTPLTTTVECGVGDNGDEDGDGIPSLCDNCPEMANPDQADSNGDGTGDVCEETGCSNSSSSSSRPLFWSLLVVPLLPLMRRRLQR